MAIQHSLERRLAGYALAAGAAVTAAQSGQAAIVYTDLDPDLVFTFGDGPQEYDLDLNNDATPDFNLQFYVFQFYYNSVLTSYYRSVRMVDQAWATTSGNGLNQVLLGRKQRAKALNSNYTLSASAYVWPSISASNSIAYMAWRGSSTSVGDINHWSGGNFLGQNRKMLALRFRITDGAWNYGWCRVSVDKKVRQFTVHDYAYEDAADTPIILGALLDPILEGTVGSQVELPAADVPGAGANFACCPKVFGHYFDPVKGKKTAKTSFKGTLNGDGSSVILDLKKKVKLYDTKAFKFAYKWGNICQVFLEGQPNQGMYFDLQVTLADKTVVPGVAHLALMAPQITGYAGTTDPGDIVTVNGDWFGVKAPKVWLEYLVAKPQGLDMVKTVKLKVLKPYAFPDARGKPNASCMNVDDGTSQLQVQLPDAWPDAFDDISPDHYLVIDNGVGLATRRLITP